MIEGEIVTRGTETFESNVHGASHLNSQLLHVVELEY